MAAIPTVRFVAASADAELFVAPSGEARRLRRWFPGLACPGDGRGPWGAHALRTVLVAPFTQLTFVSFDLQMFLFDVFHRTRVARLGHGLGMLAANLLVLAMLARLSPLACGLGVLVFLLWYGAVAATARLPGWWLLTVPVVLAQAAVALALAAQVSGPGLLLAWLGVGLGISLSHAPEPQLPPRAGDPQRWMSIPDFVRGAGPDAGGRGRRVARVVSFAFIGAADELWASLRLMPYNLLRLMLAAGYAPALRRELDDRAARAIASGNPALDYVGIGGGTFLAEG